MFTNLLIITLSRFESFKMYHGSISFVLNFNFETETNNLVADIKVELDFHSKKNEKIEKIFASEICKVFDFRYRIYSSDNDPYGDPVYATEYCKIIDCETLITDVEKVEKLESGEEIILGIVKKFQEQSPEIMKKIFFTREDLPKKLPSG